MGYIVRLVSGERAIKKSPCYFLPNAKKYGIIYKVVCGSIRAAHSEYIMLFTVLSYGKYISSMEEEK